MLLNLSQDHREHLDFLVKSDQSVVENFGTISLEFLKNGVNKKTFSTAAQKLQVGVDVIENAVHGLMQLFTEASRYTLSEIDFHDSLLLIGFNDESCKVLTTLYQSHFKETKSALEKIVPSLPEYRDLQWRFDVRIASRSLHKQITPIIYLKMTIFDGKQQREHILQTDVVNLLHMTKVLEEALKEMKSNHCRRILRNIK